MGFWSDGQYYLIKPLKITVKCDLCKKRNIDTDIPDFIIYLFEKYIIKTILYQRCEQCELESLR